MNHPEQERLVQRKSKRKRWNNDISYRIGNVISNAIRRYLNGKQKNMRKWEDLLGFDFEALKTHLERQFQPGMTWGNYGEWQIDHKVPLSHFRIKDINDPRFGECFSLSNLQPLWKEENNRKGGKLEWMK